MDKPQLMITEGVLEYIHPEIEKHPQQAYRAAGAE